VRTRFRFTVIHPVPDYERWVNVVRENQGRQVPGVVAVSLYRSLDDRNEVMLDVDLDSPEVSAELLKSENFRDLLDRAGIEIYPPVFIGELIEEFSTPEGQ
jgi:hypothetical protein